MVDDKRVEPTTVAGAIERAETVEEPLEDAITAMVAKAQEAVADLAERSKTDKGAPFATDMLNALAVLQAHDQPNFQRIKSALRAANVAIRELNVALRRHGLKVLPGGRARRGEHEAQAGPYKVIDGAIHHEKPTPQGPVLVPVANFDARIVAEEVRDDGAEQQVMFSVEGRLSDGRPLAKADVPAERFMSMNWIAPAWGTRPVVAAGLGAKDHLRAAIQMLSGEVPRCTVYGHLGWRQIDGENVYLHSGGGIGRNGQVPDIQVLTADSKFTLFDLPAPPVGDDLKSAVGISLSVLDLASRHITFPLLASVYRSVLSEALPVDFTVFFVGQTGAFKTELTAVAQGHFGSGFNGKDLPGNWSTTANALEKQAFLCKDAIFVVDDFAPTGSMTDVQRLHRDADRLLRGQGNKRGRGRMRQDGSLRPEYYPRGLILSSGEDVPRGQSLRARGLILEVSEDDVDLERLSIIQEPGTWQQLSLSLAGYAQWSAGRLDELKMSLPDSFNKLRDLAREKLSGHTRTPPIVANLMLGLNSFLDFALEVGAIDRDRHRRLQREGWACFLQAGAMQAEHQATEEPAAQFLSLLASALAGGLAHVVDAEKGDRPPNAESWGWKKQRRVNAGFDQDDWQPGGRFIGWLDGDDLLLDPHAAFAVAQRLARDQGSAIPVTAQTLWKRLAEQGKLASRDATRGRNTVRRVIQGKLRTIINIFSDALSPTETVQTVHFVHRSSNPNDLMDENDGRFSETSGKPSIETVQQPPENPGLAVPDGRNGRFGRGEDIGEPQRKNIFPDEHDDGTSPLDGDSAEREAIQEFDGDRT